MIKLASGEFVVAAWQETYRTMAITNLGNLWARAQWDTEKGGITGYRAYWKLLENNAS